MKTFATSNRAIAAVAVLLFFAGPLRADWTRVGEATAGGGAKEFSVSGRSNMARIKCLEGTVIVNTLVVREGGQRSPITVARRLQAGEHVDVDLGGVRNVTGFRISDDGRGRYEVSMRTAEPPEEAPRRSDRGWTHISGLDAGGGAKEVAVNRRADAFRIRCTSGTVIINTVVVRDGAQRQSITVARRLQAGEHADIELGGTENVSGLRISDSGRGRYDVLVR